MRTKTLAQRVDPVQRTVRRLVSLLNRNRVRYAIAGGAAVSIHGARRITDEVGMLLTPDDFAKFRRLAEASRFAQVPNKPRRFVDQTNGVPLDIFVAGMNAGRTKRSAINFPDPTDAGELIGHVSVVRVQSLIALKLAAGRNIDFADVVSLIHAHRLDESYAADLHPSLRSSFQSCMDEDTREGEFEACNG